MCILHALPSAVYMVLTSERIFNVRQVFVI